MSAAQVRRAVREMEAVHHELALRAKDEKFYSNSEDRIYTLAKRFRIDPSMAGI